MRAGLMAGVPVAGAVGWWLVARGRTSAWWALAPLYAVAGIAAAATGAVALSPRVEPAVSAAVGAAAGLALYGGTRAFVAIARRVPAFERQMGSIYDQRRGLPVAAAVAIGALVVAPGEELFWRGLFQSEAAQATSRLGGAVLAWGAYAAQNAASLNLPIVAGGIVGGAVWSGLAWWTGGVLAAIVCHALWTGLMIAAPPKGAVA